MHALLQCRSSWFGLLYACPVASAAVASLKHTVVKVWKHQERAAAQACAATPGCLPPTVTVAWLGAAQSPIGAPPRWTHTVLLCIIVYRCEGPRVLLTGAHGTKLGLSLGFV